MIDYKDVAKQVAKSKDAGGELVKLLGEIDSQLDVDGMIPGILITQAVPEDGRNSIVFITVFTNTETDFPCHNEKEYIKWVKEYAKSLGE